MGISYVSPTRDTALHGSASVDACVLGWGAGFKRDGTAESIPRPLTWAAQENSPNPPISHIIGFVGVRRPRGYLQAVSSVLREISHVEFPRGAICKEDGAPSISPFKFPSSFATLDQAAAYRTGNR